MIRIIIIIVMVLLTEPLIDLLEKKMKKWLKIDDK